MKFLNRRGGDVLDVAADVTRQVDQARSLVSISDQYLLNDPRTNPATRGHADALRTQQQRDALDAEHKRELRRTRVSDARAAAAEKTLEAIQAARDTTSPGRAVAELTLTRSRYMIGCLVLSVLLSIGSGMAIEAWLQGRPGQSPAGMGYLVEAGLTILSTAMILLRGRLAARSTDLEPWQRIVFWLLIGVPLAVSAVLATLGSPIGAVCSLGAAAWSLAAYLSATSLSTAITDALADVDAADESELRRVAMGDGQDHEEPARPAISGERWLNEQGDVMADQIAAFLADHDGPDDGVSPLPSGPDHDGPAPGQTGIPTREEVAQAWRTKQAHNASRIVVDQREHGETETGSDHGVSQRTQPAHQARRATGEHNRQRVADYWYAHPDATAAQIATALGLGESTVKRHQSAIRKER
ncbi:MFS transporter [Nocardiopsis quinghaiensis]|uniref:MFS transporter n=1 Tax=Nocardiopsis quinghaiensis TaxID=464995 RepID=UPI001238E990|nr:MFS transporter [Nocardiopsis quinghaiensis]